MTTERLRDGEGIVFRVEANLLPVPRLRPPQHHTDISKLPTGALQDLHHDCWRKQYFFQPPWLCFASREDSQWIENVSQLTVGQVIDEMNWLEAECSEACFQLCGVITAADEEAERGVDFESKEDYYEGRWHQLCSLDCRTCGCLIGTCNHAKEQRLEVGRSAYMG